MKRILFVLRGYPPYDSSSGTNVARVITGYLAKKYRVDVFSMFCYVKQGMGETYEYDGVRVFLNTGDEIKTSDDAMQKVEMLEAIVQKENYDLMVSVCYPIMAHACASAVSSRFGIPWIAYYLDPFFSHQQFSKDDMINRILAEKNCLKEAAAVIVPPQMEFEYKAVGLLPEQNEGGYVLDIPFFSDFSRIKKRKKVLLDTGYINCVYAGNLYSDIRSPDYLLRLFEYVGDTSIRLYLIGDKVGFEDGYFESWRKRLGEGVLFVLGRLEEEEVNDIYDQADVLINIGNTIGNQLPGKVTRLISVGRPILNICKIEDCPSLDYLNDYPAVLSVVEDGEITPEDAGMIRDFFCASKKYTPLTYTELKGIFPRLCSEDICGKFEQIIYKVWEK